MGFIVLSLINLKLFFPLVLFSVPPVSDIRQEDICSPQEFTYFLTLTHKRSFSIKNNCF